MRLRVRGIYTTAITQLALDAGYDVVQASPPIQDRFQGDDFTHEPADVALDPAGDRQGVSVSGRPEAVETMREDLEGVGLDAFAWDDAAPEGAVFLAPVTDTLGSGAIVDLGERDGFLPYDDADGYVEVGDVRRVQVRDPKPPWGDDRPVLTTSLQAGGGLVTLDEGRSGVSAAVRGDRATELVRTTELLDADIPSGWGVRWQRGATDADIGALGDALDAAAAAADSLDALPSGDVDDAPVRLDSPAAEDHAADDATVADAEADDAAVADAGADDAGADDADTTAPAMRKRTAWVWFGRESRFALDDYRRAVATTMPGHHRVKAGSASASNAVDFAEGVHEHGHGEGGGDWGDELPFPAVADAFGPRDGDSYRLEHGKPSGRLISLGRGRITALDPGAGKLTLEREMTGGGTYDALEVPRDAGDVAVTKLTEGKWWYPTVYRSDDGTKKGTYVNVCTPVELFPGHARYVDLHVDVIAHADGTVERVDDDELDAAVDAGHVSESLAERARTVATSVQRALE